MDTHSPDAEHRWSVRKSASRRRWWLSASLLFLALGVLVAFRYLSLGDCLRAGTYGGGTEVFLERDGSITKLVVYLQATRHQAGLLASEHVTMQTQAPASSTNAGYVPFEILSGDTIALAGYQDPEFGSLLSNRRSWEDRSLPVRALAGNHTVSTATLRGRTTLRPALLWIIGVLSAVALVYSLRQSIRESTRLRRFRRGLCPGCSYPLADGSGHRLCPECGTGATA